MAWNTKMGTTLVLAALFVSLIDAQACQPFDQIYANGTELCENMWGGAFQVTPDTTRGYSMWFFGDDPNHAVATNLHPTGNTSVCHLDYLHKSVPTPEGEGFQECHPWKSGSCCTKDTANATFLLHGYGEEWRWDRCGKLSPACERFFVQEACFYECSPHIGLYRKWGGHACNETAGGCSNTYNATCDPYSPTHIAGACPAEHNTWEVHKMPIRQGYCDAWMTACAKDLFCAQGGGNFFECARYSPTEAPTARPSPETSNELSDDQIALIAVLVGAVVALAVFLTVLYKKERAGHPLFTPLRQNELPMTDPAEKPDIGAEPSEECQNNPAVNIEMDQN
eukprot:TRINITY_DN4146_c0_g1_i1.p1 TRINITY_DN4146_c0_g1~~TRINITY_DN4146_c0_g1_i1.p1  ORF type:complete len:338 (+),score=65.83 TRINITY_DN4146_c0_g1_i1:115-1128(+)